MLCTRRSTNILQHTILSILYLRCGAEAVRRVAYGRRHRRAFNSLFEMLYLMTRFTTFDEIFFQFSI